MFGVGLGAASILAFKDHILSSILGGSWLMGSRKWVCSSIADESRTYHSLEPLVPLS